MSANNFIFIKEKSKNIFEVSEKNYENSVKIKNVGTFNSLKTAVEEAEKHISNSEIGVEYGIRFSLIEKKSSKKFFEWMGIKENLDGVSGESPLVAERDLWWVSFGENVGSEINGKSRLFSRPGLIYKKLAHGFFLVAPTTTKPHKGSWYVEIKQEGVSMFVCLHQIRTIDYRRLSARLGVVDEEDFKKVKEAFKNCMANMFPAPLRGAGPRQIAECKSSIPPPNEMSIKKQNEKVDKKKVLK
jgi:mRNA interferase MazF